ncbi:MAG TPA: hypothetical protein VIL74_09200 [Pyrinomonadaceae bacterium]|jgi:hypothetical protein
MKLFLTVIWLALASAIGFAQQDIDKKFESNKAKYKLEKFAQGEDATSGYDYFFYKEKGKIVKVREIWSSSSHKIYRAEDYYYADGKLIALYKYTFDRKFYKTAERGRNVPMKLVEKMFFTDSKLTGWIENGKPVAATDRRWRERETEALESGSGMLESYDSLKEIG